MANGQGIPICQINASNLTTILPLLQVSNQVKSSIQDAVNAGKTVQIPKQEITHNGWRGAGYIVQDPTTGAGGYLISGGLAGGANDTPVETVFPLPQIAATGVALLLLAAVLATAPVSVPVGLTISGGVIVGVEVAAAGAAAATAAAEFVATLALVTIIAKAISDSMTRSKPPDDFVILRHYTNALTVLEIISSQSLKSKDPRGIFLTEMFLEPLGPLDPKIPSTFTSNSNYIQQALELPLTNTATGYVTLRINRTALNGLPRPFRPCAEQYVTPCNEWIFPFPVLPINTPGVVEIISP